MNPKAIPPVTKRGRLLAKERFEKKTGGLTVVCCQDALIFLNLGIFFNVIMCCYYINFEVRFRIAGDALIFYDFVS